ncbi:hypothetical protein ABPG72_015899 [Tetrahymena utriculariae]
MNKNKQKYLAKIDHNINLLSAVKKNLITYLESIKVYQSSQNNPQHPANQRQTTQNVEKKKTNLEKSLEMFLANYKEVEDQKNFEKNQSIRDGFEEVIIQNQYFQLEKKLYQKDIQYFKRIESSIGILQEPGMISIRRPNLPGQPLSNYQIVIFVRECNVIMQNHTQQKIYIVQDLIVCPIPKRLQSQLSNQSIAGNQPEKIEIPDSIPEVFKEISVFVRIAQKKLETNVLFDMFFPQTKTNKIDYFSKVFQSSTLCDYCKNYMKLKSPKEGFIPPTIQYNNKFYHTQCFKEKEFN